MSRLVMRSGVLLGEKSALSRLVRLQVDAPGIQIARFRDAGMEHAYRDPTLIPLAKIALERHATMMPFVQYSEEEILNGLFGNMVAAVKTGIAAAATAQTTVALMNAYTYINAGRSSGNSSNCDVTPATGVLISIGTPSAAPNYNTYTAPHSFINSGGAPSATAFPIASQSIGLAISVGDFVFVGGINSATNTGNTTSLGPMWTLNAMWIGLSTAAGSASQSSLLGGEPGVAGGYYRIGYTNSQVNGAAAVYGIPNTQAVWGTATAATPSVITQAQSLSFPQSTAAWSTGSTNLTAMFIADTYTNGGGNIIAAGALTTPQAVNAASITLSFAASAITVTLT
jgi:hypothetical protein